MIRYSGDVWNPNLNPEEGRLHDINRWRRTEDHYFGEVTSISHILGSISSILTRYLIDVCPHTDPGDPVLTSYIKTIWNTNEELFNQRARKFKEILSKPRPILCVDPKFDPSDDAGFVPQQDFDMYVANDPESNIWISPRNSDPLIMYNNFILFHKIRRMKMEFNFNFIFDSDIQRMQLQQYLRLNLRHGFHILLHRYIENNIPDNFMDAIAHMTGMDKESEEFLVFLNQISKTPITRRLRTGSQTMEFFSMQYTPLDIVFENQAQSNGPIRRGNLNISSSFSESCTVEFTMDAGYLLKTNRDIGKPLSPRKIYDTIKFVSPIESDHNSATVNILNTRVPKVEDFEHGFVRITTFNIQPDHDGRDSVNLYEALKTGEFRNLIDMFKENGVPLDIFHVAVWENDRRLDGNKHHYYPESFTLEINDMNVYHNYTVAIYVNKQELHKFEMIKFETDKFGRPLISLRNSPDKGLVN